jgi:hypothetical protein
MPRGNKYADKQKRQAGRSVDKAPARKGSRKDGAASAAKTALTLSRSARARAARA